jgi:hypothetical protein
VAQDPLNTPVWYVLQFSVIARIERQVSYSSPAGKNIGMSMNPNRMNFTPDAEENLAIEHSFKENRVRISRTNALRYFVDRGIEDWHRENRSAKAKADAADTMDEMMHRMVDKAIDAQEVGK